MPLIASKSSPASKLFSWDDQLLPFLLIIFHFIEWHIALTMLSHSVISSHETVTNSGCVAKMLMVCKLHEVVMLFALVVFSYHVNDNRQRNDKRGIDAWGNIDSIAVAED